MEIRLKIENSPSKDHEKNILDKLWDTYRTAAPDSYLVNLFSWEFVNWAKIQISNDFTCNAYEYIKEGMESVGMQADLDDATAKVRGLDDSLRKIEADHDDLKKEHEILKGDHQITQNVLNEKRSCFESLSSDYNSLIDENCKLAEKKEKMELMVMQLKAEIYDLKKEKK